MSNVIITSYKNPDLDGVGCLYAYSELLNKTGGEYFAQVSQTPHHEAQWVLDYLGVKIPSLSVTNEDNVILVDTSNPEAIDESINLENVVEIIDHRKFNSAREFPNAKTQIELVGAAATLIAEKFKKLKLTPSKESCFLLYGAIVSNTLNFKAGVTTQRDRDMAKWLIEKGNIPSDFAHQMLLAKSDLTRKPMKEVILSDLSRTLKTKTKEIAIAQLEIIGVEELFKNRFEEIVEALKDIKKELTADIIFLSAIDLEAGINGFVYTTEKEKEYLIKNLGAKEKDNYLVRPGVILRKEIMPILMEKS